MSLPDQADGFPTRVYREPHKLLFSEFDPRAIGQAQSDIDCVILGA